MNYNWLLVAFLRPFFMVALCFCVLYPARKLCERKMKDGKLKRLLLTRVGGN